ncbi:MAG: hypothetical protein JO372_23095 [Solirubrobacterales bacterium]|nr:hypothetical protein [Solirubrobacterales bacterium]
MRSQFAALGAVVIVLAAVTGVAQAASSPGVATGPASSIGDTSAVLHGSVNPNGRATNYYFQWGLTAAYGATGHLHSAGSGTVARAVTATATGLIPGTVYHYRIVAASRFGTSIGADRTFKTSGHPPPGVSTGPAISIGKFTATVTGAVSTNGEATTWVFQYGPTPAYGYQTFGGVLPGSTPSATVSQQLLGLQPNASFHYRLVALHNGQASSLGADQAFTTLPYPRPQPRVRASTAPRTARRRPFVFTTHGSITGPFAAALQCNGNVTIRYLLGRRQVAATVARVQPDCAFSAGVTFTRLPGRGKKNRTVHLKVRVRFNGNGYLTPRSARSQTVTLH